MYSNYSSVSQPIKYCSQSTDQSILIDQSINRSMNQAIDMEMAESRSTNLYLKYIGTLFGDSWWGARRWWPRWRTKMRIGGPSRGKGYAPSAGKMKCIIRLHNFLCLPQHATLYLHLHPCTYFVFETSSLRSNNSPKKKHFTENRTLKLGLSKVLSEK